MYEYLHVDLWDGLTDFVSMVPTYLLLILPAALIGTILLYLAGRIARVRQLSFLTGLRTVAWVSGVALFLGFLMSFMLLLPDSWEWWVGENLYLFIIPVLVVSSIWALKHEAQLSLLRAICIALPVLGLSAVLGFMTVFMFVPFS